MSNFTITTPETNVHLRPSSVQKGATAAGNVTYSVTNTSGSTRRTRLRIDAGDGVHPDWVSVRDGDERDISPGATETFSVDINAPGSEEPKNLSFSAVAVNLEDPDNDFETGPAVGFSMPAITTGKPVAWWKIAVPIAAVLLIVGGVTTYLLTRDSGEPFALAGFVNEPLDLARTALLEQGVKVREEFVGETEDQNPEDGWDKIVKEQNPAAGEEVKKNQKVTLSWDWVSNAVVVSDWRSKPLDEAVTALEEAGFSVTQTSGSTIAPALAREKFYARIVSMQSPESDGSLELPTSTPVELTWKWEPKRVTVPNNLVNKSSSAAAKAIDDAGLRVIFIIDPVGAAPSRLHAQRVASVSPTGEVEAGTGITVQMKWREMCRSVNIQRCARLRLEYQVDLSAFNSGMLENPLGDNN